MFERLLLNSLSKDKLSVLLFHKVPRIQHELFQDDLDLKEFERAIEYLQSQFIILPLGDAIERLGKKKLPRRAACITFDDGYPDWCDGIVPMLLQHNLPATLFITAGQFQGLPLWNERILHSVSNCSEKIQTLHTSFLPEPLPLITLECRRRAVSTLEKLLKFHSAPQREVMLAELEAVLGVRSSSTPKMTAQQLREIHNKGFEIGAHTVGHPILTSCSDNEAFEEIGTSKEILAGITGSAINSFAYPNGLPGRDFSAAHVNMVKRAGFKYAVTTGTGAARWCSSAFQIPRFTPWGPTSSRRTVQVARNILTTATELSEVNSTKRALMVAFHFPPQKGSSGILRTLNFVKNLNQNGWQPVVLSAHHLAYESTSKDLLASIPADVPVVRSFALDAVRHLSLKGKYPAWLALPDRWSTWWLSGVVAGLWTIKRKDIKLIWSTYPIATSHMIAATLARLTGLPWVADFRDPMIGNPSNQFSKMRRTFVEKFEARVLREAACCIFTTERAAASYRNSYPFDANKCRVIENGYDEFVFTNATPTRQGVPDDVLLLLHSGIIYPDDRDPTEFFKAVAALIESGELERKRLCIRFRAPEHGDKILAIAKAQGVEDVVDIAPALAYQDAINEIVAADILLVFQGSNFNAQIPAKVYEYLRAQRLILAVVDTDGVTAKRLSHFEHVVVVQITDFDAIKTGLKKSLKRLETSPFILGIKIFSNELIKLSRATQAMQLAQIYDEFLIKKPLK